MSVAGQFHVDEVSARYWRVTFDNGPVNLLDPDTVEQLGALVDRLESDPELNVVVFRSDKPGYFMAHWDFLSDNARIAAMQPGPTGLHPYLDNFVRLSRVPVATISVLRGRARGAGSEFALATDIRFASEKAVLGQFEVGVGAVPGGGPMARLGRLVGRGRALEILLGGDDVPAALAAEYGYVNRLVRDDEIEDFADAFARRIASFEKVAVCRGSSGWSMWRPCPKTTSSVRDCRLTSLRRVGRRTSRSSSCCLVRACSSPMASRRISARRSVTCVLRVGSHPRECCCDAAAERLNSSSRSRAVPALILDAMPRA
jgi:enoyl-CoA hydratase/carnithine racemase